MVAALIESTLMMPRDSARAMPRSSRPTRRRKRGRRKPVRGLFCAGVDADCGAAGTGLLMTKGFDRVKQVRHPSNEWWSLRALDRVPREALASLARATGGARGSPQARRGHRPRA